MPLRAPLFVRMGNSRRGRTLVIGLSLKELAECFVGETVFETEADVASTSFLTERVLICAGKDIKTITKRVERLGVRLEAAPPPRSVVP